MDVDLGHLYAKMMDINNQINHTGTTASAAAAASASKDGGDRDGGGSEGGGGKGGGGGGGSPRPASSGQLVIKTSDSSVL